MNGLTDFAAQGEIAPLLISMGAGLTVIMMVGALASTRARARRRTLARISAIGQLDRAYEPTTTSALRDRRISNIPLVESMFGGRVWIENTRETLSRADVPLRAGEYLALRLLAVTAGMFLGGLIAQRAGGAGALIFFLVGGAAVGFVVPPLMVKVRSRRRQQRIEAQLVELCDVMASMLKTGYGYVQALKSTAEEVGDPLSTELQRLFDTVRLGGDIDEALDELNTRLDSRDFDIIATAISIQRRSGGNLAEILEGVAETIRQRQSFLREVSALTSKERFSAIIVAALPLTLVALLTVMDPETYGLLFTHPVGRLILGAAIALDAIGFFIIRKLTQVEV